MNTHVQPQTSILIFPCGIAAMKRSGSMNGTRTVPASPHCSLPAFPQGVRLVLMRVVNLLHTKHDT